MSPLCQDDKNVTLYHICVISEWLQCHLGGCVQNPDDMIAGLPHAGCAAQVWAGTMSTAGVENCLT